MPYKFPTQPALEVQDPAGCVCGVIAQNSPPPPVLPNQPGHISRAGWVCRLSNQLPPLLTSAYLCSACWKPVGMLPNMSLRTDMERLCVWGGGSEGREANKPH